MVGGCNPSISASKSILVHLFLCVMTDVICNRSSTLNHFLLCSLQILYLPLDALPLALVMGGFLELHVLCFSDMPQVIHFV